MYIRSCIVIIDHWYLSANMYTVLGNKNKGFLGDLFPRTLQHWVSTLVCSWLPNVHLTPCLSTVFNPSRLSEDTCSKYPTRQWRSSPWCYTEGARLPWLWIRVIGAPWLLFRTSALPIMLNAQLLWSTTQCTIFVLFLSHGCPVSFPWMSDPCPMDVFFLFHACLVPVLKPLIVPKTSGC